VSLGEFRNVWESLGEFWSFGIDLDALVARGALGFNPESPVDMGWAHVDAPRPGPRVRMPRPAPGQESGCPARAGVRTAGAGRPAAGIYARRPAAGFIPTQGGIQEVSRV
jgi:hypothetical protein